MNCLQEPQVVFLGLQIAILLALVICFVVTYLMYLAVGNFQGDVQLIIDLNGIGS